MAYTSIDKSSDFFNTVLYAGDGGSSTAISGVGFSPNWVWIKNRSGADNHNLFDTVRGANKVLVSNTDNPEGSQTDGLLSFDSDGFTVGASGSVNTNTNNFVSWNWDAGTSFTNDASSTGIGSIDSSGTANDTTGFSIVLYTGSGSAATVKHGLSTTPNMMIIKNRPTSTKDWQVYSPVNDPTDALGLNQSDATGDSDVYWNDTAPTSSVFSVKSGATNTDGASTIGYIFSNRQGFSKFGSYLGNSNADGTYVHLGFKPAFLMVKRTDAAYRWTISDNRRLGFNRIINQFAADTNAAENTGASYGEFDFTANGFKCRSAEDGMNVGSIVYMAFAENPFVTSGGVPGLAE